MTLDFDAGQKIYFISDLHYSHDREFIWKKRGYSSVYEMNSHIIESCNSIITNDDILFNLGDMAFDDSDAQKTKMLIDSINCKTHYMLWGNHRSGCAKLYNSIKNEFNPGLQNYEIYPLTYKKFVFIGHYCELLIGKKQKIILSHYPFNSWVDFGRGSWNLYGHCHQNLKCNHPYQFDVGWDAFHRPISLDEIYTIFSKKKTSCM